MPLSLFGVSRVWRPSSSSILNQSQGSSGEGTRQGRYGSTFWSAWADRKKGGPSGVRPERMVPDPKGPAYLTSFSKAHASRAAFGSSASCAMKRIISRAHETIRPGIYQHHVPAKDHGILKDPGCRHRQPRDCGSREQGRKQWKRGRATTPAHAPPSRE